MFKGLSHVSALEALYKIGNTLVFKKYLGETAFVDMGYEC